MKVAPAIEHSPCCILCGKVGPECAGAGRNRKRILSIGIVMNVIAMTLAIVAAIGGLSTSKGTLRPLRWVYGRGTVQESFGTVSFEVWLGAKARYDTLECSSSNPTVCQNYFTSIGFTHTDGNKYERLLEWDDGIACTRSTEPETVSLCEKCKESLLTEFSLIIAILAQLPTIATDFQRATLFGDVNCQKFVGVVSNVFGLFSTMVSLLAFRASCYSNMPSNIGTASMEWHLGPGFRCLMGATIIKIIDAVVHLIIPTPKERWVKPSKDITDVEDYLALAAVKQEQMPAGAPDVIGKGED